MSKRICYPGTTHADCHWQSASGLSSSEEQEEESSGTWASSELGLLKLPSLVRNYLLMYLKLFLYLLVMGTGKVVLVGHTPAALPSKIKYEDIANVSTRHHLGKGISLAPKMPAAVSLGPVHRARKGAGVTRRTNR